MSHFSVLVITDDQPTDDSLRETLLRWHEYECTGIDRYCAWVDHTDEFTKEFETSLKPFVRLPDGQLKSKYSDEFYRKEKDRFGLPESKFYLPPGAALIELTLKDAGITLFAAAKEEGYDAIPDQPGRFGRYTNKDHKWDWYAVGGRYSGKLLVRPGGLGYRGQRSWTNKAETIAGFDQARRGDLDLDAMKAMQVEQRREWAVGCCAKAELTLADLDQACRDKRASEAVWKAIPEPKPRGQAYGEWLDSLGYTILRTFNRTSFTLPEPAEGQTIDEWIAAAPPISSWGVVMDDQWFEQASMGWWGSHSEKQPDWEDSFTKLFETIRPDQWVSVVDCHT